MGAEVPPPQGTALHGEHREEPEISAAGALLCLA